jgi:hypothetical protein
MARTDVSTPSLSVSLLLLSVTLGGCLPNLDYLGDDNEAPLRDGAPAAAGTPGTAGTATNANVGGVGGGAGAETAAGSGGTSADAAGSAGQTTNGGAPIATGAGGAMGGDAGACVPSGAERCDGADNDCNDVVDEGCPESVSLELESELALIGDSPGGSAFSEDCAEGEALIGVQLAMGAFLSQIQGVCGKLSLTLRTDAAGYRVIVGAGGTLAPHPETSPDIQAMMRCPANEVLVGLGIAQQNLESATGTFVVISEIWVSCAPLSVVQSDSDYYLDWHDAYDFASIVGSMSDDSAWYAYSEVPTGRLATRLNGASGAWIDRLGFGVSNPSVALVR